MEYLIPQSVAQAILNYLVKRPYDEVAELVAVLVQLPRAPEIVEPTKDE